MLHGRRKLSLIGLNVLCIAVILFLCFLRGMADHADRNIDQSTYTTLPPDESPEDPLLYLSPEFQVAEGFHSNMPIVILEVDGEMPDYKRFESSREYLTGEEPYTTGTVSIIDGGGYDNHITDSPSVVSSLRIKKRGHTSYVFDKEQYLLRLTGQDGEANAVDVMGMGAHDSWILNGSMADKSMLRNYLSYRISSEVSPITPDSRFCEVIFKKDGTYIYQGLYLMMETVARDKNRVDIDEFKKKNIYTSYIVRRDRFTHFDLMLDTYGRLNGLSEEWIGLKYPSERKLTAKARRFIEEDFSRIEQVLYSEDEGVFRTYGRYIDTDTFVDYFLLNEYFGNYDAGMHSTYMYKNSGEKLKIGPVWDFDQAMNNYFQDEMDPDTMAFQERPFFRQLAQDRYFVELLQKRYAKLRRDTLSDRHVKDVMDEAAAYIRSARVREWYRWAADYYEGDHLNYRNYYLEDYVLDGTVVSRFNDRYDQEIYTIRVYLEKHGKAIATQLKNLEKMCVWDTSYRSENKLMLLLIMVLFLGPSVLIIRKG